MIVKQLLKEIQEAINLMPRKVYKTTKEGPRDTYQLGSRLDKVVERFDDYMDVYVWVSKTLAEGFHESQQAANVALQKLWDEYGSGWILVIAPIIASTFIDAYPDQQGTDWEDTEAGDWYAAVENWCITGLENWLTEHERS